MIEILEVSKLYDNSRVLNSINLQISDGTIYGLVGESGVGKSTLLNCMNGLTDYQEGSIAVDEVKVELLAHEDMRKFRKNMGMIFQNFSLIERKNVYKNIALPMECWGYSKDEIKSKVLGLAKLVGLEDKLKARPSELSGGQKQRVAIARALTLEPKYLLCDECTSALDPKTTKSIIKLIKDIKEEFNMTVIVVTHEMSVVKKLCDEMAILDGGEVVETGKVSTLFENKSVYLKELLGELEEVD
jgi:D-methionine transport system ATP-binding protein